GVDALSLSGHKIYGPKGIGALYLKKGTPFVSQIHGGRQERGKRAGTENVAGIVGLGKAIEIINKDKSSLKRIQKLRDYLIKGILKNISGVILTGHPQKRLPNNASFCIKNVEGEALLISLDQLGIAASSGSACTSGSLKPSHVLLAMGLSPEIAHGSLRLTLGKQNTKAEIDYLIKELPKIVQRLRKISPF
ncbi:MAG: cysteine desulfurase family protein, partial [Minisyncoccia bacterium]